MSSKISKAKKMTIDDLAVTVNDLTVTVDALAVSVAKGFSSMDEKFETKFAAVDVRFDDMNEKINYRFDALSNRLDHFVVDNVTHEEHHLLEIRVSKIEKKFKIA